MDSPRTIAWVGDIDGNCERVLRWCADVRGRGACHHPDGAVRFVESALRVFARDIEAHRRGRCDALPAGLPLGGSAVSPPGTLMGARPLAGVRRGAR